MTTTARTLCFAFATASILACAPAEPTLEIGTTAVCCCNGDFPAQYLKSSSRSIPLHQPPWEGFGFYLRFPSRAPRMVTITHYLPGVPETLGGAFRDVGYEPTDAANGLTEEPFEVRGGRWFTFNTDVGDPTGVYRYVISIDGSEWQTVEFEVHPGGNPVADPGELPACPKELVFENP